MVVFQLFGQATSIAQYAIHDEDVLEWLHSLLTGEARLPEWLTQQLRKNPLLFIGCQLSDWVSRIVARMASRHRLSYQEKDLFLVGQAITHDSALVQFLKTFGGSSVHLLDVDPAEFVAELCERWSKRTPRPDVAGERPPRPFRPYLTSNLTMSSSPRQLPDCPLFSWSRGRHEAKALTVFR